MTKRPTRRNLRSRLDDLSTSSTTDGPPEVVFEHYEVSLPDDAKVDPDEPDEGDDVPTDATPDVRGPVRRIQASYDESGDWTGEVWAEDDE